MNDQRRALMADKVVDLGHVVAGALVIGQFVDSMPWKWSLVAAGVGFAVTAYLIAWRLLEGKP